VYFLWGTDHKDQPITNAKNLNAALSRVENGAAMVYDWKAVCAAQKGTLTSFFGKPSKAGAVEATGGAAGAGAGAGAGGSTGAGRGGSIDGALRFQATTAAQQLAIKSTKEKGRAGGRKQERTMQDHGRAGEKGGVGRPMKKQKWPITSAVQREQSSTMQDFFSKKPL
jgi:hypothetical protein